MTIWYSKTDTEDDSFMPQFNVIKFMYDYVQMKLYMTTLKRGDLIERYIVDGVRFIRSEVV